MEQGVEHSFEQICRNYDLDWSMLKDQMQQSGRYHVETY
jgi:benzoyl-CoA 2,3-dioxygenase component A